MAVGRRPPPAARRRRRRSPPLFSRVEIASHHTPNSPHYPHTPPLPSPRPINRENSALWREVVQLRQRHEHQRRMIGKIMEFLSRLVRSEKTLPPGASANRCGEPPTPCPAPAATAWRGVCLKKLTPWLSPPSRPPSLAIGNDPLMTPTSMANMNDPMPVGWQGRARFLFAFCCRTQTGTHRRRTNSLLTPGGGAFYLAQELDRSGPSIEELSSFDQVGSSIPTPPPRSKVKPYDA